MGGQNSGAQGPEGEKRAWKRIGDEKRKIGGDFALSGGPRSGHCEIKGVQMEGSLRGDLRARNNWSPRPENKRSTMGL